MKGREAIELLRPLPPEAEDEAVSSPGGIGGSYCAAVGSSETSWAMAGGTSAKPIRQANTTIRLMRLRVEVSIGYFFLWDSGALSTALFVVRTTRAL